MSNTQENLTRNISRNSSLAIGKGGAYNHTNNQATNPGNSMDYEVGTVFAVQFITDCSPTGLIASNGQEFAGFHFLAGDIIYLDVTSMTTAAGEEVIFYLN